MEAANSVDLRNTQGYVLKFTILKCTTFNTCKAFSLNSLLQTASKNIFVICHTKPTILSHLVQFVLMHLVSKFFVF